jgi:hypothetical protein
MRVLLGAKFAALGGAVTHALRRALEPLPASCWAVSTQLSARAAPASTRGWWRGLHCRRLEVNGVNFIRRSALRALELGRREAAVCGAWPCRRERPGATRRAQGPFGPEHDACCSVGPLWGNPARCAGWAQTGCCAFRQRSFSAAELFGNRVFPQLSFSTTGRRALEWLR